MSRRAVKPQRLPLVWRSIIISLCSLPPWSPPCLSVRPSVRPRGARHRSVSLTLSVRSPRPFRTSFLFIPCFLLLRSAGLWRSRAAWRRRQRTRLPAVLINGGGKKRQWSSRSLPASSPAPTCSLQPPSIQRTNLWSLIFSIFFSLSWPGESHSGGDFLWWKARNAGKWFWKGLGSSLFAGCNKSLKFATGADSSCMHRYWTAVEGSCNAAH